MIRAAASLAAVILLASCTTPERLPPITSATAPAAPAVATDARSLGIAPGPPIDTLPIDGNAAARALAAFRQTCPVLLRRTDRSGLTQASDWQTSCDAAAGAGDARAFLRAQFETVRVGDGRSFATGYYEPEIAGSRVAAPGYAVPVYRVPDDLIEVDLGLFSDALAGKRIRGQVAGRTLVPYPDRAAIEDGALAGRGLEIAWAADPVDFFFLQVQGSGRLRLPDGSVMRIGYAGQNGRDYTGIGKLMKDRGLLDGRPTSMQGIVAWLREHPEEGRAIMRENKSYVFFREITGAGPIGALGVPVVAQATVAADPAYVPLGAPVFLETDRPEANGLWVAQDTGGAIKGANRFDTFWGAGAEAARIAGGMSARGTALVLVPKGTLTRLGAGGAKTQP